MLESGVPLGVTMSFLIASPTINEVALVLLWGLFGWQVSLTYVFSGIFVATLSGFIIGKLKMERYVEKIAVTNPFEIKPGLSWKERVQYAYNYSRAVFESVWLYILIGVGVGALIHGYVPVDLVTAYAGKSNPLAVPIAVLLGVPIYANCAGAIPVI